MLILHRPANEPGSYCRKPGQSNLLYRSKSPAKKVGKNMHFQASWAWQPMRCLFSCFCFPTPDVWACWPVSSPPPQKSVIYWCLCWTGKIHSVTLATNRLELLSFGCQNCMVLTIFSPSALCCCYFELQ